MSLHAHRTIPLGKLAGPRLGRVFNRQRLFDLLDAHRQAPGLWIAAPPGAGKSTLLATWLGHRREPALWLRLDADDADPATFTPSFDAVLASQMPGESALPALRPDDLADFGSCLRRRLRGLLPQMPPAWTLVFDDHHELPREGVVQAAIAALLPELPPDVQFVFASREQPPPAFARALAAQQLVLVDAQALRFDGAETRDLLHLHGHDESLHPLLAAAQGWAAGLTLMLVHPVGADAAKLPDQLVRERLFDYFADEVLARMPVADARTMGLLALLPATTPELAVALSERADAPELLERLAAASLFTDRLGDAPPVFRFHQLFGEFLQRRLERELGASAYASARLRAARLLLASGQGDSGVHALLDCGAFEEAAAAIERAAPEMTDGGRVLPLRRAIDALPPALGRRLAYWRGMSLLDNEPALALEAFEQAFEAADAAADAPGAMRAASGAAAALLAMGRLPALGRWIDVIDRHRDLLLSATDPQTELQRVPGLCAALVQHRPWHPLTDQLVDRAELLLGRDTAVGQRLLLGSVVWHLLWRGRLDRVERLLARIDTLCQDPLAAPATRMRWWSVAIMVKTFHGQTDSANADALQAQALSDTAPELASQRAHAALLASVVALARRDDAAMRDDLARANRLLDPERAVDRGFYEHQQAMLCLLDGDLAGATQRMAQAVESGRRGGLAIREHVAMIGLALVTAANDDHAQAATILREVRAPIWPGCRWHHWIAGCVEAYAALRRGDEPTAAERLREALAVARSCGYRQSPMLCAWRDAMPRLVSFAVANDIEPALVHELVRLHRLDPPLQAAGDWPWPVRLRLLGRFEWRLEGQAPKAARKQSRRLLELLRLLGAQGQEPLTLDDAADALWPDAEGDAARNALDNALHRLRRLLGADDTVLLQHGALLLNPRRCWSDLLGVERALDQLGSCPLTELTEALKGLLAMQPRALLPDDDLPAITERRRRLRRRVDAGIAGAAQRLELAGLSDEGRQARDWLNPT